MTVFPGKNEVYLKSDLLWLSYITVTNFSIDTVGTTVDFCAPHARTFDVDTVEVSQHIISNKNMILFCHVTDCPFSTGHFKRPSHN